MTSTTCHDYLPQGSTIVISRGFAPVLSARHPPTIDYITSPVPKPRRPPSTSHSRVLLLVENGAPLSFDSLQGMLNSRFRLVLRGASRSRERETYVSSPTFDTQTPGRGGILDADAYFLLLYTLCQHGECRQPASHSPQFSHSESREHNITIQLYTYIIYNIIFYIKYITFGYLYIL